MPTLVVSTGHARAEVVARALADAGTSMGDSGRGYRHLWAMVLRTGLERLRPALTPGAELVRATVGQLRLREPWGVQDPALSDVALPYWLEAFPWATVVWVQRDLFEAAEAWSATEGESADVAYRVIQARHQNLEQWLDGWGFLRFIRTDDVPEPDELARVAAPW